MTIGDLWWEMVKSGIFSPKTPPLVNLIIKIEDRLRVFEPLGAPEGLISQTWLIMVRSLGFKTILTDLSYVLDIPNDLYIYFSKFRLLDRPLDLHFGPKMTENWHFSSKMAAQGQYFGFLITLIDFIDVLYTPYDLDMDFGMIWALT